MGKWNSMKLTLSLAMSLCASVAMAQNPLSTETKGLYDQIKANVIKAADKMPEENYSFKPTPEVRSFAQLIGHVADAQYLFCSPVKGETRTPPGVEKSKTSKAELTAALKEAFAYCDAAYGAMTDAEIVKTAKFFGRERTKLNILNFNASHNNEHYGNIVTYMRLKGLVPPSSEGR
ncbi:MAG: DinB family protein [Candidatus Solibacter usitatus]|nr:DinB family protein [Candidatus Solibacter usitatus]